MLKNCKGFTLIEVLGAFGIVMMIATTLLPIMHIVHKEEEVLSEHRQYTNQLHDELQAYLWEGHDLLPPISFAKTNNSTTLFYDFTNEDHLVKGCVKWTNVKAKQETVCLYGYPAE